MHKEQTIGFFQRFFFNAALFHLEPRLAKLYVSLTSHLKWHLHRASVLSLDLY